MRYSEENTSGLEIIEKETTQNLTREEKQRKARGRNSEQGN